MDVLLAGAEYFVWHPGRAFAVSLIFWGWLLVSLALRARHRNVRALPPLVAASAWVLFGLLEYEAYRERADIRVDLLLTWPGLWAVTIICCGWWLYGLFGRSPRPPAAGI